MIIDKNSPIPQYFQLQTWLIEQIEQGIYKQGSKIPTEENLVEVTGLSRGTVSKALQNLVNLGYLIRKRRLGTFVSRPISEINRQNLVGVLVHDIRSGYAPEFLRGVGDEAAKNNFSIILCNTDDLFIKADYHINRLIDHGVCGVIFMPTAASDEKNRFLVDKLNKKDIQVVIADREIPDIDIDTVTTDNFEGAYKLTEYLIHKGHKKIAIILSTLFSSERYRLEGYKKALADHHIPIDNSLIFASHERFHEENCKQYAKIILSLKDKPSAIFAGNDPIAYIIYSVAREIGVHIPGEVSLVGYDDLVSTNGAPFSLTTMHQPIYEMGKESLKLILSRINGDSSKPKKVVLKSYLKERESVYPFKGL